MVNYTEPAWRDDVCAGCGATLPESGAADDWAFHGFCHAGCAASCRDSYDLMGTPAIEMAERDGRRGGPGFEAGIVRDWTKAATDIAPAWLARHTASFDMIDGSSETWCWRLWSGGECHAMRLTPKGVTQ
jgi:hypothetical protein